MLKHFIIFSHFYNHWDYSIPQRNRNFFTILHCQQRIAQIVPKEIEFFSEWVNVA